MNAALLLMTLLVGSYRVEDFHYYDENLQSRGLPIVNKIYVDSPNDKKEFFEALDKVRGVERFKEFKTPELDGVLVFLDDKKATLDALNKLGKKYKAYPVIIFDGIECTTSGEIIVGVQPSVNLVDFNRRLNSIAEGNFRVEEIRPKQYVVTVDSISNPSNNLILANLLANDSAWNRYAMVGWIPLDGYVKANAFVETPAISHLGEWRNFKIMIDVFNPDIVIRTDLLPQMGQSLVPFPFGGEVWFDPAPPEIIEQKNTKGKTVTVNFRFRQLQYGTFMFQPIQVTYERNGELQTVRTNTCQYNIRSVIQNTDIDDIQSRTSDGLDLVILKPVAVPKTENPLKSTYFFIKMGIGFICFSTALFFMVGALITLKKTATDWFVETEEDRLWNELRYCDASDSHEYYMLVSRKLNDVLTNLHGVSLFTVDEVLCTKNFKNLVNELSKVYQQEVFLDPELLRGFVKQVCKDRRYK